MKMHQVAASILCMALLLALCLSAAYSEEIIPFAESGNNVQAILRFSNGKAISDGRVAKLEAGCTASTTVYVQAKCRFLYTSDAADDLPCVDPGGRRIHIKKNKLRHPACGRD